MSKSREPVFAAIRKSAHERSQAIAIRMIGDALLREISYGELQQAILHRADTLQSAGIQPGDRIALLGQSSSEWLVSILAIFKVRATAVPLDIKLTDEQLGSIITKTHPAALILESAQVKRFAGIATKAIRMQMETGDILADGYPASITSNSVRPSDLDPEMGAIVFTSGSTLEPKGVMLSRESIAHATNSVLSSLGFSEQSELLCVLPFHHVLGIGTCLAALQAGSATTLLQELRGDLLLAAMQKTGTTFLPGPPRLFELLLTSINAQIAKMPLPMRTVVAGFQKITLFSRKRLARNPGKKLFKKLHQRFGGCIEIFLSGGAALPGEIRRGLEAFGFTILEGYGLTETAGAVSTNTLAHNRPGSVGRPFPDTEIIIANQDVGGEGEICVRSPSLMRGYFQDPVATAESFREDGWLRTGDLGKLDRDGFVTITGRIKELIVTAAGKNVSPEQVEWQYRHLDGVQELAVLGMPGSSRYGEEVHAAVVPINGSEDVKAGIDNAIAARSMQVPSYLRIQRVHLVEEIPRTTTLKIRRGALRQLLLQKLSGKDRSNTPKSGATAMDAHTQKVIGTIRQVLDAKRAKLDIRPESNLVFDLGFDSMGLVELASVLEHTFGIDLDLQALQACKSVADLAQLIQNSAGSKQDVANPAISEIQIPPLRTTGSKVFLYCIHSIFRWLWGLKAEGVEHIPQDGVFIICPNHESHLDGLFVTCFLPEKHKMALCTFAKREHFDARFTRFLAKIVRAIPVDRKGDFRQALRAGTAILKAGRPVFIHPEGTRTRDGSLLPFRRGAAHLALQANAAIIPVRIDGAFAIYPPQAALPKVLPIKNGQGLHVRFGKPILPAQFAANDDAEQAMTAALRRAIIDLGEEK